MMEIWCAKCSQLSNNIVGGICIVEKGGKQLTVCAKCSEELQKKGWTEVSRARGL